MDIPLEKGSLAVVLAGVIALGACGGGSDEQQVRDVIELGNQNNQEVCDKVTANWLDEVTGGDRSDCVKQLKNDDEKFQIAKVSIHGDRATATGKIGREAGKLLLLKQDGEWKLDDAQQGGSRSGGSGGAATSPARDEVAVRGAYDAFVEAAEKEDETVFCGLMSERYAARLIGRRSEFAIAECLEEYKDFDFTRLQRALERVEPRDITVTGDSAVILLSDGERVLLERDANRWVIDNIES